MDLVDLGVQQKMNAGGTGLLVEKLIISIPADSKPA